MTPRQFHDAPNTIPWPPLIYAAAILTAIALAWMIPLGGELPGWFRYVGVIILLVGLALDCSAMIAMRRNHANILPHRAATVLVTSWPFSISRNPIYLGNTLALIGAAFACDNPWLVALSAVTIPVVTILAIQREGAHLAELFGETWRDYATHVPRWVRQLP